MLKGTWLHCVAALRTGHVPIIASYDSLTKGISSPCCQCLLGPGNTGPPTIKNMWKTTINFLINSPLKIAIENVEFHGSIFRHTKKEQLISACLPLMDTSHEVLINSSTVLSNMI